MKKFLKIYAAVLLLLFVGIPQAYANIESKFINADIDDAKIGELYYELNTKTHKAAVVCKNSVGPNLSNNYGTSIDVPSTVKFLNPANYYQEEEFTVVEIARYAFHCPSNGDQVTHLSIPSTVVYLGQNILYGNLSICEKYGGSYYFDNCLVCTEGSTDHALRIRPGTRIISERCIDDFSGGRYVSSLYFPEGKITLCGNINWSSYHPLRFIELWGTEIDGSFYENEGVLTINNYSGKIDYSEATYKSLNVMYITRDIARYHTSGKNAGLRDKVVPFHFKVDNLYYELLNKDEAVVVHDDSYSSLGKVVIPEKVTYNKHTFKVTTIDPEAFAGTNITSVTLPGTIKTIGQGAFSGCKKLTEVNFADEINAIGKQAFMGCTALKELHLNQVANIASETFKGCTTLTTLFSNYQGIINAHSLAFDGLNKGNITVQVASSLVSKYKADAFWKDFIIASNRYKVDGLWYEIGSTTAKLVKEKGGEGNYAELTGTITIPKDIAVEGKYYTVTLIETGALQWAPMTKVDLRAEVKVVPEGFCFAASNLEEITLPESVVKIGDNAFNSCTKLKKTKDAAGNALQLYFCPKLLSIGNDAFNGTAFETVLFPLSLTTIGEGAFAYCKELTKVYIQENVSTIGKYAFQNCTKLEYMRNYALAPQPFTTDMLYGVDKDKLEIEVQYGALNAFKTADGWKDYKFTAIPEAYYFYDEEDNFIGSLWFWIDMVTRTATLTKDFDAESPTKNYAAFEGATIEIPEKLIYGSAIYGSQEITVTGIDNNAFWYAPIKKIILPETVKKIDSGAFYYTAVEEVQLPENVASFGEFVFCECSKLKSVNLPTNLSVLPAWTFQRCPLLEHIVLPDGLQEIGALAFDDAGIRSITIPDNVTKIGDKAFRNCTSLYEIYNLASTPQTITSNVFEGLTLKDINLYVLPGCKEKYEAAEVWKEFNIKEMSVEVDGLSYRINPAAKTAQVTYDDIVNTYKSLSGKVTVPASITFKGESYAVTGVFNYAFSGNTTITEIVLPEGLKTIGWDCFDKMTKLTSLNIPSTVESVDRFGTNGISSNDYNYKNGLLIIDNCLLAAQTTLDYIVHVPDGTRLIAGSAFQNCKEIIEVNVPASVKTIGSSAFSGCKKLGKVTFPEGLQKISERMFFGCEYLDELTLPESIEEIGEFAFGYNCNRIEEVYLPANVRKIGKMAFQTSAIKQLWLPAGIQEIGNTAFAFLDLLEDVYCYAPDPAAITLGTNVFQGVASGAKLHVPYGSLGLYAAAEQWKDFTLVEMPACIDGFYYILDKVNHTATVTYDAVRSDDWNSSLKNYGKLSTQSWTIPAKVALDGEVYDVTGIGDKAFYQTNVAIVVLPEGLKSIGDDAFADTYEHYVSLTAVVLPSTLTSIGGFAFYNQRNLREIYNYAATPQDISGKGVFSDGTYGTIDKSKITLRVPYGCSGAYKAADEWKDFTIVEMPVCIDGVYYTIDSENGTASVTYQYFDDVRNYADLRRDLLVIPATITVDDKEYEVTTVADGAFANCKNIKILVLPEGLTRIGDSAFGGSGITMITLPSTLTKIDAWAFAFCENLAMLRNFAAEPLAVADFKNYTKGVLQVPAGSKEAYMAADVWKEFTITEMNPCVDGIYYSLSDETGSATVITDYTGHNYSLLGEEIEIPQMITVGGNTYTVTNISNMAFNGNTVLRKLTLPALLGTISPQAFSGCTSLREIVNHRTAPAAIDETVFDGLSKSACTLYVHRESVEAYKAADEWKEFGIVSIETPIMIAGQPIRSDMYGKPLVMDAVHGEVIVTANSIYLGEYASVDRYDEGVPAIELFADESINTFFIGGKNGYIKGYYAPAIRVSGNVPVTLNINTHYQGDELFEGLDLGIEAVDDEAIAFANGMEATLNLNSLGAASTNRVDMVATNQCLGLPPSAHCDIRAAGYVDFNSITDVCPIGVFNTSSLTLRSTNIVLPYGGEVKDEGIFDAFGNDCFRLHLAPINTQSGKAYPVTLGGMTVSDGNKADILGDGKASYDPATNTLTLDGAEVEDYGQVLQATAGLRVEVKGESSLVSNGWSTSLETRPGVEVQGGDFIIQGDKTAKLNIFGAEGVQCDETEQYRMEVRRCEVNIDASYYTCNYALQTDSLCIHAGTLTLNGHFSPAWLSWNTAEDGGLVLEHASKTYGRVNQDELMEFEPVSPLVFQVTVEVDDEKHGTVTGGGWFEDGTSVSLTATTNEGYKFVRWSDGSTDETRTLTVDDDYSFTAIFADKDQFIVTFVGFGGVAIGYDYVYAGNAATAPDPQAPEGYTFTGWDTDFTNIQSTLTVTAQYAKNEYTVTFIGFDGETVLKEETVEYGEAATAPVAPEVEHYTFTGWDTNDYNFVSKDLTVNAVYEIDKFNVIFVGFGGVTLKEEVVPYGGSATAPSVPFVEGYDFKGWDTDFTNVQYDLTVTALYESNVVYHTLSLAVEGNGKIYFGVYNAFGELQEVEATEKSYTLEEGSQFLVIAHADEGWQFSQWADGETKQQRAVTLTSDISLKAIFTQIPVVKEYTVTFLGFNDVLIASVKVKEGEDAQAPEAPAVEGYEFKGWDTDFTNVQSDLTVKAKYEINHYVLTLVAGHGTIAITDESGEHNLNPDMVMHGTIVKLIVTADDGYLFKGWSDSNTDNPRYVTVTEDKTFTALFEKEPDDPTGVEEVESQKSKVESTKLLRDGVLYILREGKMYNVQGQKVQ